MQGLQEAVQARGEKGKYKGGHGPTLQTQSAESGEPPHQSGVGSSIQLRCSGGLLPGAPRPSTRTEAQFQNSSG